MDLARNQDFATRLKQSPIVLRPPLVEFLNNQQIIISFDDGVISDPGPILKPFGFHVLEVNVNSGKIGRTLSFSVLTDNAQAKVIKGGRFLVLAGEDLDLFSSDFAKITSRPTPLRNHGQPTKQIFPGGTVYWNPRYERWQMDVAPSGTTILLAHAQGPLNMELQWLGLDADNFVSTKAYTMDFWSDILASDRGALVLQAPATRMLLSGDRLKPVCNRCMVRFVTDDLLFVSREKEFTIESVDGNISARGELSVYADPFARAQGASRFVYATGAYSGYGFPLVSHFTSVHSDVRVYDWKEMRQVADVRLSKPVGTESAGFKQLAVALSPDGKKLVILDDSKISCYLLP